MKMWRLYILCSVLSLCLSCAIGTHESAFTRRKKVSKPGTPNSQSIQQSRTDYRKSSPRSGLPTSISPMSPLSSQRPYPPLTPRPMRPGEPKAEILSDSAYLPDVSVTCSASDVVVRVKPAFYGLGAETEELKLGSSCKSNGVLRPYSDLLFTYPLTACDAVRESSHGYLLYKYELHYEPSRERFPRMTVDIECRYQRSNHVHRRIVRPTWETAVVRKMLKGSPTDFQIALMDDSWSTPAESPVYQLGETINFEVSAPNLSNGGKLYINTCHATPSSGSKAYILKYTIIDNFGCLLDSKSNPGASQFISRTDNSLRFSLKAFQFTSDPYPEISIHCSLFVTPEDAGPAYKSCTYIGNGWKALSGDDSICECCDSQCVTSKPQRAMMEGSASSASLLVSDQLYAKDAFLPVSMNKGETPWKSADVVKYDEVQDEDEEQLEEESGVVSGVTTEPDLEELGLRRILGEEDCEVKDSNQFQEDGSGYVVEGEMEGFGGEDEIPLNQKEGKVLNRWRGSREVEPLVSEGREENWKPTDGGEEDDGMTSSEVEWKTDGLADFRDDSERTWYFTWR
ncbi:zona pellucida sperm-binding protein 3-like [Perca fluviatilis]|nr:zona pellucida sperm-binding protein 3-like [Perca fluviatilis]